MRLTLIPKSKRFSIVWMLLSVDLVAAVLLVASGSGCRPDPDPLVTIEVIKPAAVATNDELADEVKVEPSTAKTKRQLPTTALLQRPDKVRDGDTEEAKMAEANSIQDQSPTGGPLTEAEMEDDEYVPDPEIMAEIEAQRKAMRRIADTYGKPANAKPLGKDGDLWVDSDAKRIYIDGYVSLRRGPLEMLACPVGSKEHESVIAVFAKSSDVHAALLAIGARSGTTARWDPEFLPPTGQAIAVWVAYRDPKPMDPNDAAKTNSAPTPAQPMAPEFIPGDTFHVVDARQWIRRIDNQEALTEPWVFAGSGFWTDPADGKQYYSANGGDMICVSNFSTAMLDVPFASSADAGNVLFEPFEERIPERGTPVRLILAPQPIEDDNEPIEDGNANIADADADSGDPTPAKQSSAATPPDESILPIAE